MNQVNTKMDYKIAILLLISIFTLIYTLTTISTSRNRRTPPLPPGPKHFPIIGSLTKLGTQPHKSLASLSKTYGPLMSLKLGTITTIVTSSPKIAKEIIRKEDQAFANRRVPYASHALDHSNHSIFWLPIGNKWKNLRKICKEQMFSVQKLDASENLRRKAMDQLIDHVRARCLSGELVDIGRVTFTTSLNILSIFFFSRDFGTFETDSSSHEFMDIVSDVVEIYGKPNLVDYFPMLELIDPEGIRKQASFIIEKYFGVFDRIIEQRLEERASSSTTYSPCNDVLDCLLDLCQNQKNDWELSCHWLKHFLSDLIVAGTDTNSSTVEWAMAELLRSPSKLAKARSELLEVIGNDRQLQESDISRLPYLQAIIKETLRLHPPAPFVIRRKCGIDVEVQGFTVPKDAIILYNLWASGRDSNVWSNADDFIPERFLECDEDVDYRGQHCELIPFGAGKRICPGLPLAYKMMHLMLGLLIYSFEWKREPEAKAEDIDMSEKFGLTLRKVVTLKAIPVMLE